VVNFRAVCPAAGACHKLAILLTNAVTPAACLGMETRLRPAPTSVGAGSGSSKANNPARPSHPCSALDGECEPPDS
jgi:hypothetical protein